MDRMDPDNFDRIAHERRTTVRAMEIGPDPDATRTSPGYRFVIEVGRNTSQSIALNAREIWRLASVAAKAALEYAPDECGATVGQDGARVAVRLVLGDARVRALHRPVEYRPGDRYANYGPPSKREVLRGADERPEVVTVCEECQAQIDEILLSESGGYGSWGLAGYPCRTIRAADGEELGDE